MTSKQIVDYIRILLDDTTDWHSTTEELINAVNDAQYMIIEYYYAKHEEIPLRPLHRYSGIINNGDIVMSNDNRYLYLPRSCRVFYNPDDYSNSVFADYITPNEFDAYIFPSILPNTRMPQQIKYTIKHSWDNNLSRMVPRVYISEPNLNCELLFIAEPLKFTYDRVTHAGQTIEIADEYHVEVAHLAADILMDMDIDEKERETLASLDIDYTKNNR